MPSLADTDPVLRTGASEVLASVTSVVPAILNSSHMLLRSGVFLLASACVNEERVCGAESRHQRAWHVARRCAHSARQSRSTTGALALTVCAGTRFSLREMSPQPWIAKDVNQGHLDWFFWLLAGLVHWSARI